MIHIPQALLRPREKMLIYGEDALSDRELIALIVGSGTRSMTVSSLAGKLLDEAGGLRGLANRKGREMMGFEGIGPARAARLLATFTLARRLHAIRLRPGLPLRSSRDVFEHYHPLLRDAKRETFIVLLLDSKNRVMKEERISQGSLTASIVHPREVFHAAIRESAAALLALHNHPSGDPSPSREDYEITVRLREVGELVGIRLVDHVILGEERFVSFREHGLIEWD
jgi:DNA repair protein RadC